MFGEIRLFRRSLFGGFDKRDVLSYISALAEERNKYRASRDEAEKTIRELREETQSLSTKLADSERRIQRARAEALEAAEKTISELESACENVRTGIEATSFQIRSELVKVGDSVELMSSVLKRTGERLSEMRQGASGTEQEDEPEAACE